MIKNRNTSLPNVSWYLFVLIFINIPVVQLCKKSSTTTTLHHGQRSMRCNQNISTNLQPLFSKVQQRNVCPFTDLCLQVTTGNVSDYARLYYKTGTNARKTILQGYLICGGDGVSVIGTTPTFEEFYVTLISSRPWKNNRFFVDESGSTWNVFLQKNISFDIDYSYGEEADTLYSHENNLDLRGNQIEFDLKYPKLPNNGFVLNIVTFYDIAFKTACHLKSIRPDEVIEKIFDLVETYFKDKSLLTMFHLNLIKTIYKSGVLWNKASDNGTEMSLKKQNLDNKETADIFVHMGLMTTSDDILGKVPKVGRCFSNNQTCSGVCSSMKYEKSLVVQGDINDLPMTAYIITHEIGHLLGLKHDFQDKTDNVEFRRPKHSIVDGKSCTNVNGIMDYGNKEYNNLKWTNCSSEYLRMYHKKMKDTSTHNSFCLQQHGHTRTVDFIPGQPLNLICDIRKCDPAGINYIKWFLNNRTYIGHYFPAFDETKVVPEYSHNINISCEAEMVILQISSYENYMNKAYCLIEGEDPKPYCETKQTFDVKDPGILID